jgi:hypothetical protein
VKKILSASLLAAGLALAGAVQAAPVTLLNVSYDVMRDFYKDYNAAFQKHWEAEHPNDKLTLQMSFGGSSKQARSVIDGLPADVITMNMATDINALADNGKLVPDNWVTRLPDNSPGRGFVRLGAGDDRRGFQAARIARPLPGAAPPVTVRDPAGRRLHEAPVDGGDDDGPTTEMEVVVERVVSDLATGPAELSTQVLDEIRSPL